MNQGQNSVGKALVEGAEMAYRFDGPEDGNVVIMSHSMMLDHSMWDDNVPSLADRYRVLRYDIRGHGRSQTTPGPYSLELLADDAVGLLDALGIEKVHFAGLSIGGMIAQQVGARYPERVHSLALCDTASEWPVRSVWDERFAIVAREGITGLVDSTIKRWFTGDFIARYPQTIERVRRMIVQTGDEGFVACGTAVRELTQTTMLLRIQAPTLIIVGREDPACTVDQATVIHRVIEGSEMVVLENAGHLSNIEQAEAFNGSLRGFLDRVEQGLAGQA